MKCELYNDSMQSWKCYPIQKAQLIIADVPYNVGNNFYIECKAVEKLNLYDAMAQAKADAHGKVPVVIHKKNNCNVLVTMEFEQWAEFYKAWEVEQWQSMSK